MLNEILERTFGMYVVRARIFPAIILLLPIWILLTISCQIQFNIQKAGIGLFASICVMTMLGIIARHLGKRLENKLIKKWGGRHSTIFLRHRDSNIDSITKTRYHAILAKKIGRALPSPDEENNNPDYSDQVYSSCVAWLLEHTRDRSRFSLLFAENVHYGFCRNAYALRPYAIGVALSCLIAMVISQGILSHGWEPGVRAIPMGAWGSGLTSLAALVVWVVFIKEGVVCQASETYARTLLRACDTLGKTTR